MTHIEQVQEYLQRQGGTMIAFSLLSQGHATCEGALVAYEQQRNHFTPFMVHVVRFEIGRACAFSAGGYHTTIRDMMKDFRNRLERDGAYLDGGAPLTGQPQEYVDVS